MAALLGQVDAVQGLLSAGADYKAKDKADHTAEEAAKAASQKDTETVLAAHREQVAKTVAEKLEVEKIATMKKAELVRTQKVIDDAKAAADAATKAAQTRVDADAAQKWFDQNLDKDHKNLAIAGVDEIQVLPDTTISGLLDKKVHFQLKSGANVLCKCSGGLLTVTIEGDELPNMGSGDVRQSTGPSGNTRTQIQRQKNLFTGKIEQVTITEPDGTTKPIKVHTYTGPITKAPDGNFEWNVANKAYKLSMEKR